MVYQRGSVEGQTWDSVDESGGSQDQQGGSKMANNKDLPSWTEGEIPTEQYVPFEGTQYAWPSVDENGNKIYYDPSESYGAYVNNGNRLPTGAFVVDTRTYNQDGTVYVPYSGKPQDNPVNQSQYDLSNPDTYSKVLQANVDAQRTNYALRDPQSQAGVDVAQALTNAYTAAGITPYSTNSEQVLANSPEYQAAVANQAQVNAAENQREQDYASMSSTDYLAKYNNGSSIIDFNSPIHATVSAQKHFRVTDFGPCVEKRKGGNKPWVRRAEKRSHTRVGVVGSRVDGKVIRVPKQFKFSRG